VDVVRVSIHKEIPVTHTQMDVMNQIKCDADKLMAMCESLKENLAVEEHKRVDIELSTLLPTFEPTSAPTAPKPIIKSITELVKV
jgi:hypothetical protein